MPRLPRRTTGEAARLHRNRPPALLVGRSPGRPPSLKPADIVDCFRLTRSANGLFALTLQFRDGRLKRVRMNPAFLRPLQRALAAAARRWFAHGHAPAAAPPPGCRCIEAAEEDILREVHLHGLKDAVVVMLGLSDGPLGAAFEAGRARELEAELRRLSPPAG